MIIMKSMSIRAAFLRPYSSDSVTAAVYANQRKNSAPGANSEGSYCTPDAPLAAEHGAYPSTPLRGRVYHRGKWKPRSRGKTCSSTIERREV
jgi:hypothetical protein